MLHLMKKVPGSFAETTSNLSKGKNPLLNISHVKPDELAVFVLFVSHKQHIIAVKGK